LISYSAQEPAPGLGFRPVTVAAENRPGAQSSAQTGLSAMPPKRRKSRWNAGSRMARPGLEPGTPRFSVVRSRLSNGRELPANKPISVRDARGRIFVNSILLPPIREMEGASSPNTTPRPESTSQRSRPRPRRAGSILATPRRRSKRLPTAGQRQGDLGADAGARARRTVDDQGAGQSGYAVLQAGEPAAG
jgi:hypothetical protein